MMKYKAVKQFLFMCLCVAVAGFVFGRTALVTIADVVTNPEERALQDAMSNDDKAQANIVGEHDVMKLAYDEHMRGCSDRHAFFVAMSAAYQKGQAVTDVAPGPIFYPLVQDVFDKIKAVGVEQATVDSMQSYQKCQQQAKPIKDASKNYDDLMKFGVCGDVNSMALDALKGVKGRVSMDSIISKYKSKPLDLSNTSFADSQEDFSDLIVGKIYQVSKDQSFADAINVASVLSVKCSQ